MATRMTLMYVYSRRTTLNTTLNRCVRVCMCVHAYVCVWKGNAHVHVLQTYQLK